MFLVHVGAVVSMVVMLMSDGGSATDNPWVMCN